MGTHEGFTSMSIGASSFRHYPESKKLSITLRVSSGVVLPSLDSAGVPGDIGDDLRDESRPAERVIEASVILGDYS